MITENLSTLKIHNLTKEQYERELAAGRIDENALYLTPYEETDLSEYATQEYVDEALAGKQPVGDYALKSEIPTDYLTAIPSEYITETELNAKGYLTSYTETDPTVPAWAKAATKPNYTASEVGAVPTTRTVNGKALSSNISLSAFDVGADANGTASSAVSSHNTNTSAHNDIRDLISGLTTRLNALADSDDTTLDQLSEIVTYIKNNKSLIDGVTTNKINVSDIVDNLTTNVSTKPLSAAQGVALKALIDALQAEVDGKAGKTHTHAASDITSGTLASARLPAATSSAIGGVKVGSNISVSSGTISVPSASGSVAGVTIVYPAASCTTFSSDTGTVTPLAVQKGAKMFAITRPTSSTNKAITRYSNATGDVQDSKIIIEDVSNTRDSSKKAQVIAIPAEGGKKMVYGYCTDQIDGTSFIGGVFDADATEYPYRDGLAIGGTTGNLLWKGAKVATVADIESAIGAAIAASY